MLFWAFPTSAGLEVRPPQLDAASTVMQLWLLRSEIYQAVSDQFGQQEAMRRVKLLTPEFEGLLPERQLRSV